MMFDVLGYPRDHPRPCRGARLARQAAGHQGRRSLLPALRVAGVGHRRWPATRCSRSARERGGRQPRRRARTGSSRCRCSTCRATGSRARPDVRPGGWAFQYANPHYPDLDDTAVVVMAMDRAQDVRDDKRFPAAIDRGREWIVGLQSQNGGWGAFDADNDYLLSQQHPVRRPRRAARSADRGRHRPLRLDAGAARRSAGDHRSRCAAAIDYLRRDPARRRKLVRPLGHELHLRHLVGAVRAQRRGRRSRRARDAQGGATGWSRSRTRMAAGARTAPATSSTIAATRMRRAPPRRPPGRCSA